MGCSAEEVLQVLFLLDQGWLVSLKLDSEMMWFGARHSGNALCVRVLISSPQPSNHSSRASYIFTSPFPVDRKIACWLRSTICDDYMYLAVSYLPPVLSISFHRIASAF